MAVTYTKPIFGSTAGAIFGKCSCQNSKTVTFGLSNIYGCSATIMITSLAGNFHESYCIAMGMKNHCNCTQNWCQAAAFQADDTARD